MHPDSLAACGALCSGAMSPELLAPGATGELAGAQSGQGLQKQLKEMETAVVSRVCSGKSFWGQAGLLNGVESGQKDSK